MRLKMTKRRTNRYREIGRLARRKRVTSGAAATRNARNGAGNCNGYQSHEFKCKQDHDHGNLFPKHLEGCRLASKLNFCVFS
jgi:hypothetical protein